VRLVLDTDVLVAALRSPSGASAAILRAALKRRVRLVASVPLMIEYEAVMTRGEHLLRAGLGSQDVRKFLDELAAVMEPTRIHYLWRPQLSDAGDDLVLEAAVNGQVQVLVTFNLRHFLHAAQRFAVDVLRPGETLRKIVDVREA
jgi:putative PIN family toxin of toxin-antitoxin system